MAPSLAASHHCPASRRTTSAPPSARTLAAMPPPAPDPTMQPSYSLARLAPCMVAPLFGLGWRPLRESFRGRTVNGEYHHRVDSEQIQADRDRVVRDALPGLTMG